MMGQALLKDILPDPDLQEYIRKYQVVRFVFDKGIVPPIKFHTPRPEHCITFYVRDAQRFSYANSPEVFTYPQCVVNGMYNIPIHRYGGHDFLAIKVILQPTILFHLIKIDLQKLTNKFINAQEVWGNKINSVCAQLSDVEDLHEMIQIIESFFQTLLKKIPRPGHPFDEAICFMLNEKNAVSIDWLANQSCLSTRQFIRKFEECVGISAKTFQRIIRFDAAFRMKNGHPDEDWLSIAIARGYYDYQHLVKDFKEFTHLTPPAFYEVEKKSPERSFGLHEE